MNSFVSYLMRDVKNENQAQDCCLMLYYARRFLKKLTDFHQEDRSPLGDQRVEMIHDPQIQKGLTHYSMVCCREVFIVGNFRLLTGLGA